MHTRYEVGKGSRSKFFADSTVYLKREDCPEEEIMFKLQHYGRRDSTYFSLGGFDL